MPPTFWQLKHSQATHSSSPTVWKPLSTRTTLITLIVLQPACPPSIFLLVSIPLRVPLSFGCHFSWQISGPGIRIILLLCFNVNRICLQFLNIFSLWHCPHLAWCSFLLLFSDSIFKLLYATFLMASQLFYLPTWLEITIPHQNFQVQPIAKFLIFSGHVDHKLKHGHTEPMQTS